MSRGFDGFEIDSFRNSDFGSRHDMGRGSSTDWSPRTKLQDIHRKENGADSLDREGQKVSDRERPPLAREARVHAIVSQRTRTKYADRNKDYCLRDSEVHTLSEVGRFRVVATNDLANFAYAGNDDRMKSDIRNLTEQGLIEQRNTSILKKESRQALTLTRQGYRFIRRQEFLPEDQAIYHGFVKPKEANHDADLYRLYHRVADKIERERGRVLRVALDYELKEKLYKKLGEAQARDDARLDLQKQTFARQLELPVVEGKVILPDMRIEYETHEGERARVDVELATSDYHGNHLAEKAKAGFQIYARSQDADGLRRIRDEREITTAILSF
ncbi:MAG TPA: hypothetical protein VFI60_08330 [Candidatus Acidoferrum sp.]|nr:hypothetical protein [Candidatus Acidoferrum sp.]